MKDRNLYAPTDRVVEAYKTFHKASEKFAKLRQMLADTDRDESKSDCLLLAKTLLNTAASLPALKGSMKEWAQALRAQERACK